MLLNDGCCRLTATFTAATPVELAAGDSVALSASHSSADEFTVTPEGIRIHNAGTYMVLYTVHVPANEAISSRFMLTLNGERIPFSSQDVSTVMDHSTNGYTMHATLDIPQDGLLKLVSMNPVSISGASASNVFTLSLTRIP